jgi:thioesterase domain-containing protein
MTVLSSSLVADRRQPDVNFDALWPRDQRSPVPRQGSMVKLADGTGTPFHLVHWAPGNIAFARDSAGLFSMGHPVYGFEAAGLRDRTRPLLSVSEMAEHYLRELTRVQPQGPYLLGGLCSGAQVAFEMASRLVASGAAVGPLILANGGRGELMSGPVLELGDLYELKLAELRHQFHLDSLSASLGDVMAFLRSRCWIDDSTPETEFYWRQLIWAANVYAHQRFKARPFTGSIELFLCGWAASDPSSSWHHVASSCDVTVLEHETTIGIIRDPAFAAAVRRGFG